MKLTESQLRRIVQEEMRKLSPKESTSDVISELSPAQRLVLQHIHDHGELVGYWIMKDASSQGISQDEIDDAYDWAITNKFVIMHPESDGWEDDFVLSGAGKRLLFMKR